MKERAIEPAKVSKDQKIMIAAFLYDDFPFLDLYFDGIEGLNYNKDNIVLFINFSGKRKKLETKIFELKKSYKNLIVKNEKKMKIAKKEAMKYSIESGCQFYFTTDSVIENKDTLVLLMAEDKHFVAPLLTKYHETFSNVWCAIDWWNTGYKHHPLYYPIVKRSMIGIFDVPIVWVKRFIFFFFFLFFYFLFFFFFNFHFFIFFIF